MLNFRSLARWARAALVPAAIALLIATPGAAQRTGTKPGAAAPKGAAPGTAAQQATLTAVPTKPTDAVALVNGEVITRGELAAECISRYGVEVLDTVIARKLIQQAIVARKLQVTAKDVDAEINRTAENSGVSREQFLTMLAKERNVSPRQYADYIAYPSVALRMLSEPRVQVTDKDLDEAYQAYFGEKLRCRVIMVPDLQKATDVWNQVKSNPGGFAQLAKEKSIDAGTAPMGGMLTEPIMRFGMPRNVTESAFEQLVDGDAADIDAAHKPKDGSFTGPIQVSETAWIILKREALEPGQQVDRNDPKIREDLTNSLRRAKLESEMQLVMEELMEAAEIENSLTGLQKVAQREIDREMGNVRQDATVKRMSNPDAQIPAAPAAGGAPR